MGKSILFVAIDVDDNAFHGAAKSRSGAFTSEFKTRPNVGSLVKKLEELEKQNYRLKICYEATYLGFSLFRDLRELGYDCEVIAPTLIPGTPGRRVKTDRLDARKMVDYFHKGLLTAIFIPEEEDEADRGLLRSRRFLREQVKAFKCHINMLSRKYGWHYREETGKHDYWTDVHVRWIEAKIEGCRITTLQETMRSMIGCMNQLEENISYLDEQIQKLAESDKYRNRYQALTCYRGLKTVAAMTLITEIGDIKRFAHPNSLCSYFGLDIAEYSSGGKELKFGITKQGNEHGRFTIVESNQNVQRTPRLSKFLKKRRQGIPVKYVHVADRCATRLHTKAKSMLMRGKNTQLIKVACAREMLGFVWESMRLADGIARPRNIRAGASLTN